MIIFAHNKPWLCSSVWLGKSSCRLIVAVPNFPTTIPPALLAKDIDSDQLKPTVSITAKTAITVSPAPDTS